MKKIYIFAPLYHVFFVSLHTGEVIYSDLQPFWAVDMILPTSSI